MPQPVTIFLRQALLLRIACAECLDKPKPRPVHHLRSASRRLEATIELLAANAGIPGLRASSKPLRRSLRKIRRAAGAVRDLDVYRELLAGYQSSDKLKLDKKLKHCRDEAAQKLQRRLAKDERKIHRALEDLEAALKPALDLELSGADLARFAQSWFASSISKLDVGQDDQLHSIRKASKTARYLAENGADVSRGAVSRDAEAVAARFEQVQQTLGDWHDHLLLLAEARENLSGDSELVKRIDADCRKFREQARAAAERLLKSSGAVHRSQASGSRKKIGGRRASA